MIPTGRASHICSNLFLKGKKIEFTYKKPFDLLAEGLRCANWLPESDAHQNGQGLLFEFSFGQLNATKGEKRLLPAEAFNEASCVRVARTRNWSAAERLRLAQECQNKLAAYQALSRKALARQLNISPARLNQLIGLL